MAELHLGDLPQLHRQQEWLCLGLRTTKSPDTTWYGAAVTAAVVKKAARDSPVFATITCFSVSHSSTTAILPATSKLSSP
ncbi:hypothetical protein ABZP36_028603 [Zizania latifolia]